MNSHLQITPARIGGPFNLSTKEDHSAAATNDAEAIAEEAINLKNKRDDLRVDRAPYDEASEPKRLKLNFEPANGGKAPSPIIAPGMDWEALAMNFVQEVNIMCFFLFMLINLKIIIVI